MKIQNDRKIDIATGRTRRETNWQNKQWLWSELLEKLSATHRTVETHAEYIAAKKTRQDEIKDVGGFVGAYLNKGRRKNESVVHRQLITLDLDFAKPGMWDDFQMLYGNAACIYSTHKHSPESPRLRLIMPLDREVMADEYVAIARKIAGDICINDFDPTGFRPAQLMYWPSTPKDGEFVFEYQDGPWLSADNILNTYHNWQDASEWPMSEREKAIPLRSIKKQGDPLEKSGIVGAFCRTYSISSVIENFLSDIYEACDIEDRYTYKEGSTAAGLVVYEDKYAYSHHGTDPISGKLCNAFDLVRLHKYGLKDEDAKESTPANKLPSFIEMQDFAAQDKEVRKQIGADRVSEINEDFDEPYSDEIINQEWLAEMDVDRKGNWLATRNNILLILENDAKLKGCFALDIFEHREIALKNLPWRNITPATRFLTDADDAELRIYIEKKPYQISNSRSIADCITAHLSRNSIHPLKNYLDNLSWDGEERAEKIFIDYLGAEDNDYTRAVARKWLAAAVTRIYRPGCKFDYLPVLIGKQGLKKSMLADKLGRQWYSDSFSTIQGKEAFEQLQGAWIIEVPELSGFKKADSDSIKHYITKRKDRYRVAYGRRVEDFPRQSVFIGTGNNRQFLSDTTGNRRWWPIDTHQTIPEKDVAKDLTEEEIGQIWAEAVQLYKNGEELFLTSELEEEAYQVQSLHLEEDPRKGLIEKYLNTLLPVNWNSLDIYQRREWLTGEDELQEIGTVQRDKVCVAEIFCEVLGGRKNELAKPVAKDLNNIMRSIEGWELFNSSTGKSSCKLYGTQRFYRPVKKAKAVTAVKLDIAENN